MVTFICINISCLGNYTIMCSSKKKNNKEIIIFTIIY